MDGFQHIIFLSSRRREEDLGFGFAGLPGLPGLPGLLVCLVCWLL